MNDFRWAFLNKNENLFWKGISRKDRHESISEVEKVINHHGFIIDFHMFSDMEICLRIEVEEQKIKDLYADLRACITLNDFENFDSQSNKERTVFLNITFTTATGNLKIEVPSVPS